MSNEQEERDLDLFVGSLVNDPDTARRLMTDPDAAERVTQADIERALGRDYWGSIILVPMWGGEPVRVVRVLRKSAETVKPGDTFEIVLTGGHFLKGRTWLHLAHEESLGQWDRPEDISLIIDEMAGDYGNRRAPQRLKAHCVIPTSARAGAYLLHLTKVGEPADVSFEIMRGFVRVTSDA